MKNEKIARGKWLAGACGLALAFALVPVNATLARGAGGGGSIGVGAGGSMGVGAGGSIGAGGSMGLGTHGNAGASTGTNVNAGAGGDSSAHMSTEGSANSNGPNSTDRDFGKDRAEDRANAHSLKHLTGIHHKGAPSGKSESDITDDLNNMQLHGDADARAHGHM